MLMRKCQIRRKKKKTKTKRGINVATITQFERRKHDNDRCQRDRGSSQRCNRDKEENE